jgi:hypothetical protein
MANISETFKKMEDKKNEELDEVEKERMKKIEELEEQEKSNLKRRYKYKTDKLEKLQSQINAAEEELIKFEEEIQMQEVGLYKPRYNFLDAISYKERLDIVRKEQKQMIKDKTAAISTKTISIDGSEKKGQAMTNANIKQILRTFNLESEVITNKVKHSNIESSEKRLQKSFDQLNRLYSREFVQLTQHYLNLKLDELHLAYEYEVKKEEEKELLREAREKEREEKKLQKELEREKKKFEKENTKLNDGIEQMKEEMMKAAANEKKN